MYHGRNPDFKFKPGDKVYYAGHEREYVSYPCPVCHGKLWNKITLGNGEEYSLTCDYCSRGTYGPTGNTQEYKYKEDMKPEELIIQCISEFTSNFERYAICGTTQTIDSRELFSSLEECEKYCEEQNKLHKEYNEKRIADSLKQTAKKASWSAGYYLNRIKDAQKQIDYCNKQIKKIKG